MAWWIRVAVLSFLLPAGSHQHDQRRFFSDLQVTFALEGNVVAKPWGKEITCTGDVRGQFSVGHMRFPLLDGGSIRDSTPVSCAEANRRRTDGRYGWAAGDVGHRAPLPAPSPRALPRVDPLSEGRQGDRTSAKRSAPQRDQGSLCLFP